jgi:hypothetical protein
VNVSKFKPDDKVRHTLSGLHGKVIKLLEPSEYGHSDQYTMYKIHPVVKTYGWEQVAYWSEHQMELLEE